LQILLENAIKQNFFSDKEPLVITISTEKDFINVSNAIRPKPYKNGPANPGLATLKARFNHLLNGEVMVLEDAEQLLVKVPFRPHPR
jgi:LytS/YehU family sensor histidine kinase